MWPVSQSVRQSVRPSGILRQTDKQADRQASRQTDRQAGRQADRQTRQQAGRQASTHSLGEGLALTRRRPPSAASESALEGGRSAMARSAPAAARGVGDGAAARLAMAVQGKEGRKGGQRHHARTRSTVRPAGQPARGNATYRWREQACVGW